MTRPADSLHRLLLLLVLAISAFVQLTVVSRTTVGTPLRNDAGLYYSYAWNLREHGVYSSQPTWLGTIRPQAIKPDKLTSPGYPLFLLALGPPRPDVVSLMRISFAQAGLALLTVFLGYLLASRFLPRGLALVGALIMAISPHMAIMSTYILTETLFTTLLMASVLALVSAAGSGRGLRFAVAGLLWGAASLVRPVAEFFLPLVMLAVMALPALRSSTKNSLIAFACFLIVLSPWVIRNSSPALDEPSASLMVNALAHGSYPGFKYDDRPESYGFPYVFDPNIKKITRDLPSVLGHIASSFEKEPSKYITWYILGKPFAFLSWANIGGVDVMVYPVSASPIYQDPIFVTLRSISYLIHWPLMILAVCTSIVLTVRWLRGGRVAGGPVPFGAILCSAVFLYAIGFHMLVAPFPRYAIPFRPLAYFLALYGINRVWRLARGVPHAEESRGNSRNLVELAVS